MPKRIPILILFLFISSSLMAERVIPSGKEDYFLSIIRPYDKGVEGYLLKNVRIDKHSVTYEFCKIRCFYIILKDRSISEDALATSKNFAIYIEGEDVDVDLSNVVKTICKNDRGEVFSVTYDRGYRPTQIDVSKYLYAILMLFVVIWILSKNEKTKNLLQSLIENVDRVVYRIYPVLFFAILCLSAYLRFRNIYLPLSEGGSALRLLYSQDSAIYNLFISDDPRHPGLYFALLKPIIQFSSNPVYSARIMSASLSVLSVAAIGILFKDVNPLNSILSMLTLTLYPEYIYRSREITDISLFVLNSIIMIYFFRKSIGSSRVIYRVLFALFVALSCLSSYAAYINLIAVVLYILFTRRVRYFAPYLICSLLLISPYVIKILISIKGEFYARSIAARYPSIVWGESSIVNFANLSLSVLFGGDFSYVIMILLLIYLIIKWRSKELDSFSLLLFLGNLSFLLLSLFFRMRPYYLIFLPVSAVILVAYEKVDSINIFRRLFSLIFFFTMIFAFYQDIEERFEITYVQSYHLRTDPLLIVKRIKETGVKSVVLGLSYDRDLFGYYLFNEPFKTLVKKGCIFLDEESSICEEDESGIKMVILMEAMGVSDGWQKRVVKRLMSLDCDDYIFVYNRDYPNNEMLEILNRSCNPIYFGEKYLLYRCKR